MPELPEVKVLSEYLNKTLSNLYIRSFNLLDKSRYTKIGNVPNQKYFKPYSKILEVKSRGKKIIFILLTPDNNIIYLISFLGMEGHWVYQKGNNTGISMEIISILPLNKNRNIEILLYYLYYDDSRRFGILEFVATQEEFNNVFKDTGPDLLQDNVTLEMYKKEMMNPRNKNTEIGIYLLKQEKFSGIGNYLRADILYMSKINPFRKLGSLSDNDINNIYTNIMNILRESYINGGLTISTYRLPNNEFGRYESKIYNKKISKEGFNVIKEKMKDGRSIHWVKEIQI